MPAASLPRKTLVPLGLETESIRERFGVDHLGVESEPEINGLPKFDPLLELRLLMLDPDPMLERSGAQMGDRDNRGRHI